MNIENTVRMIPLMITFLPVSSYITQIYVFLDVLHKEGRSQKIADQSEEVENYEAPVVAFN